MELTAHDKWLSEYDADCSLTDDELLLIKDAWNAATEHAAITGAELEQFIQDKWSAGYTEGFRRGKELVIPVGYKLVPIVPTEAMLTAGYRMKASSIQTK